MPVSRAGGHAACLLRFVSTGVRDTVRQETPSSDLPPARRDTRGEEKGLGDDGRRPTSSPWRRRGRGDEQAQRRYLPAGAKRREPRRGGASIGTHIRNVYCSFAEPLSKLGTYSPS